MNEEIIEKLKVVFSDADLLDVDFSRWDSMIGLYVVADHLTNSAKVGRMIIAVRFFGVRRFDWVFRHHGFTRFPLKADQKKHLQWNIYKSEMTVGEVSVLTLTGSEQFPVLHIEFQDVSIEEIDRKVFDEVNPDWSKPGSGLARPSIEQLHVLINR